VKTYKIWSNDLGYPEEDAYTLSPEYDWYDMEDTVHQLITSKYTESWENPKGVFEMKAQEVRQGVKLGDVHTFAVDVDWEPHFYITDKNPPKAEHVEEEETLEKTD